jgi:hypothetical protein
MSAMYLALMYSFIQSALGQTKLLNRYLDEVRNEDDNVMKPSIQLKATMLKWFKIASGGFLLCKAV